MSGHGPRRNLVIVRAGEESLHEQWLLGPGERNWDLIVSYFGDDPERFRADDVRRIDSKGPKWPALHHLLNHEIADELDRYDYIWLPDDDLAADTASINTLFDYCARFDLSLAQPALSEDGYVWHGITRVVRGSGLRYTNFVEVMAPCFSRAFLARCAPGFDGTSTGWGLDYLWPRMVDGPEEIAVIDAVTVRHTRPFGGPNLAAARASCDSPDEEFEQFLVRHGIVDRSQRVYRRLDLAETRPGEARTAEPTAICVTATRVDATFAVWLDYHGRKADLLIVFVDDPADRPALEAMVDGGRIVLVDGPPRPAEPTLADAVARGVSNIRTAIDIALDHGMVWLIPLADDELFHNDNDYRWQSDGVGQVAFVCHEAVPARHEVANRFGACTVFRVNGRTPFMGSTRGRSAVRLSRTVCPVDAHEFRGFLGRRRSVTAPVILRYPYPSFERWKDRVAELATMADFRLDRLSEPAREFLIRYGGLLRAAAAERNWAGARSRFDAGIPDDDAVERLIRAGELRRFEPLAELLPSRARRTPTECGGAQARPTRSSVARVTTVGGDGGEFG